MKKFYLVLGLWAALFSVNAQNVATFESIQLDSASWWNGSDGTGGITSGGFWFPNNYNQEWGSWSGISVSNMKDTITPGYENQYSAITASGASGSENYATVYTSGELTMEFEDPVLLSGFYVTNSTYAYLAMKYGDEYSKKFGGADGTDPDYFKLIISGTDIYGEPIDAIEFYLADFTSQEDSADYILNTWKWVDLSSLGVIKNIQFSLGSSDVGDWGINTPAYFCMDNFNGLSPDSATMPAEAGIEDLNLADDSYYNGSDGAGSFTSGGFTFKNSYNTEWESWSGFAASSKSDTTTAGWANQYSSITGSGALQTENYAVAFPSGAAEIEFDETVLSGFYITNSTYAYLSMSQGDDYAKKFGGADGNDPDWFKVTITGISGLGDTTSTLDYYLADFRFEENEKDYILDDWQWVDLSSLGEISKLQFSLSSSDDGDWGMNTPGYFCIDQLNHPDAAPEVVNPIATIGEEVSLEQSFYVALDSVFTDQDNPNSEIEITLEYIENAVLLSGMIVDIEDSGSTQTMLSLNITPEMTGEAEVVISASSNGKKTYHSFKVMVQYPVTADIVVQEKLNVYPNPFNGHLNIDLPNSAKNIMLTNLSGQAILKQRLQNQNNIRLSDLIGCPSGVYILIVETSENKISRKVLKF